MVYDSETNVYRIYNELNQLSETRINNATGTLLQKYTFDPIEERIFIKDEYYPNGSLKSSTYYFGEDYIIVQNSPSSTILIAASGIFKVIAQLPDSCNQSAYLIIGLDQAAFHLVKSSLQ